MIAHAFGVVFSLQTVDGGLLLFKFLLQWLQSAGQLSNRPSTRLHLSPLTINKHTSFTTLYHYRCVVFWSSFLWIVSLRLANFSYCKPKIVMVLVLQPPQYGTHSNLAFAMLPLPTPFVAFLKLTASSRPSAPPSDSPKCLRFGHWLTLCTLNIHLLTYLLT